MEKAGYFQEFSQFWVRKCKMAVLKILGVKIHKTRKSLKLSTDVYAGGIAMYIKLIFQS